MSIDRIAMKSSTWAWDRQRESERVGLQLGEESITDFLVLNLKKWGSGKLLVDTFTRRQESLNGADWEWWLTDSSGKWLGMRVQAKILNLKSAKYEHLHFKNKHGSQVETLLKDAKRHNLVPMYCLYSYWKFGTVKQAWKCKTHNPSIRHYGASLLSPYQVKAFQTSGEKKLNSVATYLRPMHCLFCSSRKGTSDTGLAHKALDWLKDAELLAPTGIDAEGANAIEFTRDVQSERVEKESSDSFVKTSPPHYVRALQQGAENWQELNLANERLRRITIFTQTDEQST